eukprot:428159-Prymnesium_polylepis.1
MAHAFVVGWKKRALRALYLREARREIGVVGTNNPGTASHRAIAHPHASDSTRTHNTHQTHARQTT